MEFQAVATNKQQASARELLEKEVRAFLDREDARPALRAANIIVPEDLLRILPTVTYLASTSGALLPAPEKHLSVRDFLRGEVRAVLEREEAKQALIAAEDVLKVPPAEPNVKTTVVGTTKPGPANENSPLLELPAELRNRIYELAIIETVPISVPVQPALTQVCSQLREEATHMFYERNTFKLDSGPEESRAVTALKAVTAMAWLQRLGSKNRLALGELGLWPGTSAFNYEVYQVSLLVNECEGVYGFRAEMEIREAVSQSVEASPAWTDWVHMTAGRQERLLVIRS